MSRSKVEIQVIDEKLLIEGLITNKIVSESDTLRGTSDINLVEIAPSVNTLILSFKRIGKIENLVGFNALTKLCLDNNAIEEICHLDHLTNLKWLDLSFNKIHRIQGLDKLSKLEDLSLYSNYIKKIDGLWNCSSLQCLSLGNNKIESLEEVQQLRKIRSLRMLTLSDNPVTDQPDYKTVVLAFISELKYLDYRLVMQEDRNTAKEIHADILDEVEQNENVYKEEKEREAKLLMEISKLEEAGISYAQTLFDDMFKDDTDLEKLLHFPFTKKIMEESFQTPYRELEESHTAESLKKYYQKRSQIVAFEKAVQELRNRDDNTSTLLIENYHRSKKQMVANFEKCQKMVKDPQNNVSEDYQKMVKELQISLPEHQRIVADTLQISFDSSRKLDEIYEFSTEDYQKLAKRLQTKIVEEVQKELDKVCDELMGIELRLVDKFDALVDDFYYRLQDLKDATLEMQRKFFPAVVDLEKDFNLQIRKQMIEEIDSFQRGDQVTIDRYLSTEAGNLIVDKELCMNLIQSLHEKHTSLIATREDQANELEKKRFQEIVGLAKSTERQRNRNRVLEIHEFGKTSQSYLISLQHLIDDEEDEIMGHGK